MAHAFKVFFSNRLEILYQRLKKSLFESSNPFTHRLIVVPSPAMKSWLMVKMAKDPDLSVAMGVEMGHLDQSIMRLHASLSGSEHPSKIPSLLELALGIESEIRKADKQEKEWAPLTKYLKLNGSRKGEHRLVALSEKLAHLFTQYGKYAGSMVKEWEEGKGNEWQARLWQALFSEKWSYPYRELLSVITDEISHDRQIHLFGMNFISKLQHRFLLKVSKSVPIHYYMLSPCQPLWSDLLSDRESRKLQSYWKGRGISEKQQMALEEYLSDKNPLLANFGRLGREMATLIEESDPVTVEDYVLPKSVVGFTQYEELIGGDLLLQETSKPLTMLDGVQADMVLLRNLTTKISLSEDRSIQVHVASTAMREVQVLYESLMTLIDRHAKDDDPITPGDIIVMAPDIRQYEPYVKAVFESEDSQLDYKMMDVDVLSKNSLVQGFVHLLSLPFGRWDAASLLQLFDYPAFQECHRFSYEDILAIRTWVKEADIRWGENVSHRDEILKRDHCRKGMMEKSEQGTWENGVGCVLSGLVLTDGVDIDTTQAELLGKWIKLLRSLRKDLRILTDRTQLTPSEWATTLRNLSETYFHVDEKMGEELNAIINAFHLNVEETFPFSTIKRHLESLLKRKNVSYRESHLNAVRFCTLLPMRAIPAKVVVLLGMTEGAFPKQDDKQSLNLMQEDYCPSQTDYDRFLFLETLLSARQYYVIIYQEDPSLLVSELFSYLDDAFSIDGKKPSECCVTQHPFYPFDKTYFNENSEIRSYSQNFFSAAKAYYRAEKSPFHCFVPEFTFSSSADIDSELCLELRQLAQMARNPVQAYFNNTLGIYLDKEEERQLKNEEDFQLSPLESAILRKHAVTHSFDEALSLAKLPFGPFKELTIDKLKDDVQQLLDNLSGVGIEPKNLFEIDFQEHYTKPTQSENGDWHLPPLEIGQIKIVGKFSDITPKGWVAHIKDDKKDVVKLWPQFLVLNCLIQKYAIPVEKNVVFAKSGKIKSSFFDDPFPQLQQYLDYYFASLKHLSPLIPEWVSDLISKDPESFKKVMHYSVSDRQRHFYNDYVCWMMRGENAPKLIEGWQKQAKLLFEDLYNNWYVKK